MVTDAAKAIPMQMFMLWMSGNSVQIFRQAAPPPPLHSRTYRGAGAHKGCPVSPCVRACDCAGGGGCSIMITAMLLFNGAKGLSGVSTAFDRLQGGGGAGDVPVGGLLAQKLAMALVQLALMALGLYKCHTMGLLPTSHSDWLAFVPIKTVRQHASHASSTVNEHRERERE
jgi:hypothetical protein